VGHGMLGAEPHRRPGYVKYGEGDYQHTENTDPVTPPGRAPCGGAASTHEYTGVPYRSQSSLRTAGQPSKRGAAQVSAAITPTSMPRVPLPSMTMTCAQGSALTSPGSAAENMSSTGRFSVLDNTEDVGAKVADDHGGVSRRLSVDGDLDQFYPADPV